jgi:CheY-like chemotaxis protein
MSQQKKTVLFIDDEPAILSALRRAFHSGEWNLLFACSGKEGLEMVAEMPVDVVVCDLHMPEMNGVAVLEYLQKKHAGIGRLMLSAYVEADSLERALADNCSEQVLIKPWNENELRQAINKILTA